MIMICDFYLREINLMIIQNGLLLTSIMSKIQSHLVPMIFITHNQSPEFMSSKNYDENTIINNWVILPNSCIAGTAFRMDTELKDAPNSHSKTDTRGVSNYKDLPPIATNVVLSLCCQTTLGLDPTSDFGSMKEYSNITTLSGSSYYLTNKRNNTDMNRIIKYYNTNDMSRNSNLDRKNSINRTGRDSFLGLPQAQIKRVLTASFMKIMVHNNQSVCQVCPEDHDATKMGNVVYLFLPLFEYTQLWFVRLFDQR